MQRNWKHVRSASVAALALCAAIALPSVARAQGASHYVMKLSTATVNDHQHEWLKRFAAAVEKIPAVGSSRRFILLVSSARFPGRSKVRSSDRSRAGLDRQNFWSASIRGTRP